MEIEAWRDDQWEKLRLLSEHGQHDKKDKHSKNSVSNFHSGEPNIWDGSDKGKAETVVDGGERICTVTVEEKKKAKAAAKRKRAKERKKAKQTLEKVEAEKLRQRQASEAQRSASVLKCGSCGTGILTISLAFERFDQFFCSPKCARTAVKVVLG